MKIRPFFQELGLVLMQAVGLAPMPVPVRVVSDAEVRRRMATESR